MLSEATGCCTKSEGETCHAAKGYFHLQEAAREAAPDAIQIADRFHLSQNAGEMVVRIMRRNYDRVKEILDETPQSAKPIDQSLPFQRHEADKQVSQQRRMAVYEHVILLYEQGCSPTEIAAQLRMSRNTTAALM